MLFLALLVAALLHCGSGITAENVATEAQARPEATTFLFPILRYGPNNQKRDLRQIMAIAKQLDCGLVLTGLYKHYRDTRESSSKAEKTSKHEAKFDSDTAAEALRALRAKGGQTSTRQQQEGKQQQQQQEGKQKQKQKQQNRPQEHGPAAQGSQAAGRAGQQSGGGALAVQRAGNNQSCLTCALEVAHQRQRWEGRVGRQLRASGSGASTAAAGTSLSLGAVKKARRAGSTEPNLPRCFEYKYQHFMEFSNVLDVMPISEYLPVASVGELRAMGWDGVIDAFMFREGHGPDENGNIEWHMTKTLRSTGVSIASNFVRLPVKAPVMCDPTVIAGLQQRVRQFRVVALLHFVLDESEFPDYSKLIGPEPQYPGPVGKCRHSLWQTERLLRPAAWIQELAARYVNASFGDMRFLAVHVRPLPDECLDVWKLPKLEDKDLKEHCSSNTQGLHHVLGQKILQQLDKHKGISNVFIMAHPAIRHNIQALLSKELRSRAQLSYLDEHTLTRLAGCVDHSATFMAMAEEEVAVQADVFLGTASSSITHSIVAERVGLGHSDISFVDL